MDVYKILLLMRLLKLSQWKVMTEFATVMLEVSFIYCQPIANAWSGQLHPSPENMFCLPSFALPFLHNSIVTQLFCEDLLDSPCEEDSVLSTPMVTSSAEHAFSHKEKPFGNVVV